MLWWSISGLIADILAENQISANYRLMETSPVIKINANITDTIW